MKEEGIAVRAFHLRGGRSFSAPLRLPALRRAGRVDSGGFLSASSGATLGGDAVLSRGKALFAMGSGPAFPGQVPGLFPPDSFRSCCQCLSGWNKVPFKRGSNPYPPEYESGAIQSQLLYIAVGTFAV